MNEESGPQRYWVYAHIDEPMRNGLMRVATEVGMHVSQAVEHLLNLGMATYAQRMGDNVDPYVHALAELIRANEQQQARRTVLRLASLALRNQSEEDIDRLTETCEKLGFAVDEILGEAEDNKEMLKRIDLRDTPLRKAELWLLENMQAEYEYASTDLKREAQKEGISASALKSAKNALGIRAVRKPNHWAWVLPTLVEDETPVPLEKVAF